MGESLALIHPAVTFSICEPVKMENKESASKIKWQDSLKWEKMKERRRSLVPRNFEIQQNKLHQFLRPECNPLCSWIQPLYLRAHKSALRIILPSFCPIPSKLAVLLLIKHSQKPFEASIYIMEIDTIRQESPPQVFPG